MNEDEREEVHFRPPRILLQEFDEAFKGHYTDRTAALLSLMRAFVKYRRAAKAAKEA